MTPPPQMVRLAEAFGAEPFDSPIWGSAAARPAWHFWGFDIRMETDGEYAFLAHADRGHGGQNHIPGFAIDRHTVQGVADEIRRRWTVVAVGDHEWRVAGSAEVVGGWVRNARVYFWCPDLASAMPLATRTAVGVSCRDDPAGWALALGALYHRLLGPLVDYVLERPAYEADHERLYAAWSASIASVGTTLE